MDRSVERMSAVIGIVANISYVKRLRITDPLKCKYHSYRP